MAHVSGSTVPQQSPYIRLVPSSIHHQKPFCVDRIKSNHQAGNAVFRARLSLLGSLVRAQHTFPCSTTAVPGTFTLSDLHIPSSACSLPLRLLYWVDSHSSVKILLKCHFLHEAIAEPFSNTISLFSPLYSDLQCITSLSDDLFAHFSNAL